MLQKREKCDFISDMADISAHAQYKKYPVIIPAINTSAYNYFNQIKDKLIYCKFTVCPCKLEIRP